MIFTLGLVELTFFFYRNLILKLKNVPILKEDKSIILSFNTLIFLFWKKNYVILFYFFKKVINKILPKYNIY
jgi:hypothetical protein